MEWEKWQRKLGECGELGANCAESGAEVDCGRERAGADSALCLASPSRRMHAVRPWNEFSFRSSLRRASSFVGLVFPSPLRCVRQPETADERL